MGSAAKEKRRKRAKILRESVALGEAKFNGDFLSE
jgi:hypothetical protein